MLPWEGIYVDLLVQREENEKLERNKNKVDNMNFLKNWLATGWAGFKHGCKSIWHFIEVEIPELMSNWRLVPRLLMLAYGWAFLDVINWFMALENPNNAQAGLVSVVVGAGAGWFAIYVNGKPSKVRIKNNTNTITIYNL